MKPLTIFLALAVVAVALFVRYRDTTIAIGDVTWKRLGPNSSTLSLGRTVLIGPGSIELACRDNFIYGSCSSPASNEWFAINQATHEIWRSADWTEVCHATGGKLRIDCGRNNFYHSIFETFLSYKERISR